MCIRDSCEIIIAARLRTNTTNAKTSCDSKSSIPPFSSTSSKRAPCRPGTGAHSDHHIRTEHFACVWANHQVTDERRAGAAKYCLHYCGTPDLPLVPSVAVRVFKDTRLNASLDGHPFVNWVRGVYRPRTYISTRPRLITGTNQELTSYRHPVAAHITKAVIVWLLCSYTITASAGFSRIERNQPAVSIRESFDSLILLFTCMQI